MRYLEGQPPNPDAPYSETMHSMISLSMVLAIIIGICLFLVGRHGKIMWMKFWSVGLIACGIAYLTTDLLGIL